MKKSIVFMCIGALLALSTPLAACESTIEPPHSRQVAVKKKQTESRPETPAADKDQSATMDESTSQDSPAAHTGGGVIIISGGALLVIIILLILFC